jgi:hypothetical protein
VLPYSIKKGDSTMQEHTNNGNVVFQNKATLSLRSITTKQDLDPKPRKFNIHPPPSDGSCDCCEKPFDELKPFPKYVDRNGVEHNGRMLRKTGRAICPRDEEIDKIMDEYTQNCKTKADYDEMRKNLIKEYGEKKAEEMELYYRLSNEYWSSRECSECFYLSPDDYYPIYLEAQRKLREGLKKNEKQ